MDETPIQRSNRRLAALKAERDSWDPIFRDLAEHFLPRKSRWLLDKGEANKGYRRSQKMIDGTPRYAARTCASGLMAGLTSPARPWMRLVTPDPDMMEIASVKYWLEQCEQRMRDVFAKSNLYNMLPSLYGELCVFGTAPMIVVEDSREVIRCRVFTAGSYYLANSARLSVDTLIWEDQMTVRQLVQEYGLDALSDTTRSLYQSKQFEKWIPVVHLIAPRADHNPQRADNRNMPWESCHYEAGSNTQKFLRESGFEEFPVMAPRWDPNAEDVYGSSPAMDALGDAKQLQHDTKKKAILIDKIVDPPMNASSELQGKASSLLPGGVTYHGFLANGNPAFTPAYLPNPQALLAMKDSVQDLRQQISKAMYEDLFLMLAMSDRAQITAREIAERHEEKLLMLGPVLERLNDELLDPLVDRTFNIMLRRGLLPPPPDELEGVDLKVEYISILAQAQKMVATDGLERLTNFTAQIAQAQPDVLDKIDFDQAIDEYGAALGVPARVVRSDDEVAELRQARQKQQQAAQMAQAAGPLKDAASAAKTLSETEVNGGNALESLAASL